MFKDMMPDQLRNAIMPSLLAGYREWVLVANCGRCDRSTSYLSASGLANKEPSLTVEAVIARLRCSSTRGGTCCRGAPDYVALQASDQSLRVVLLGKGEPMPRVEHLTRR